MQRTSVRMHCSASGGFWTDSDPVECFHESPAPRRFDAVVLKLRTHTLLRWGREMFEGAMADDVPRAQVPDEYRGRKRRDSGIRFESALQDIVNNTPDNSLSFFTARLRTTAVGSFDDLQSSGPVDVALYELALMSSGVIRGWTIDSAALDSYDDVPREPFPSVQLTQELVVLTFETSAITEVSDHEELKSGKRPMPEGAA